MFDIKQLYYFYYDLLFTPFGFIILTVALIVALIGIFFVKRAMVNAWGAAIAFVLYLVTLIAICYREITLGALLVWIILSDVFLGGVLGFIIAVIVIKVKERAA